MTLALAILVAPLGAAAAPTVETFVEPPIIKSSDGVLRVTLTMAPTPAIIPGQPVTGAWTYNGLYNGFFSAILTGVEAGNSMTPVALDGQPPAGDLRPAMPVDKVSLSLDADLVAQARRVAGHRGLSALVNDALRIKLQHERLRAVLAEMDAEFGPVPADELDRARATWPAPVLARRKPRRSA